MTKEEPSARGDTPGDIPHLQQGQPPHCPTRTAPNPRGAPCQASSRVPPGHNGALIRAQRHPQSAPCSPHALTSATPRPPHAALRGAPAQRGPVVATKSMFLCKIHPPPAQTMCLLWQAQRRGRVEGLAGPSPQGRRGQGCPQMPLCGCWALAVPLQHSSVTISCPLRTAHGTVWWQLGASGSLCALPATWVSPTLPHGCHQIATDLPKCTHRHKTTRTGCDHQRESCRLSRWAPRHHSDGKGHLGPLRDTSGGGLVGQATVHVWAVAVQP